MPQQPSPPQPTAEDLAKQAADDLARIRARSAPPRAAPLKMNRRASQPPMKLFGQTFRSDMTPDEMVAQMDQAHDPGTAIDRFVDEWWKQNNPKNMADALWDPATGRNLITDTIPDMLKAPGVQLQKAIDAYKAGEPMHALQHGLSSVVPIVGPALGNMADQFREGNTARGVADFVSLAQAPAIGEAYQAAKGPVRAFAGKMLNRAADAGTPADAAWAQSRGLGTLSNRNRDEAMARATPSHPSAPPPPPPVPGSIVTAGRTPLEQLMKRSARDPVPDPLIAPSRGTPNTVTPGTPVPQYPPMREPPAAWQATEDAAAASAADMLRKGATRQFLATKARPNNAVSGAANIAGMAFRPKPMSAVAQGIYNTTTVPADLVRNAVISHLAAQPQMRPPIEPMASHTQPQVRDPVTGQLVPAKIDPVTGKLVPIR